MSYRFVAAERAAFPVRTLCRLVGVAASGFYAWLRRRPGRRREDDRRVSERVGAIFAASRRTYGSPRVHAELREEGVRIGRERVARLMREMGLSARRGRRRTPRTTDSRHDFPIAPNLLDQDFAAERPDAVWLADISYIPTGEGWLYLAAIKDLATREIVGWSMADHLGAEPACDALRQLELVPPPCARQGGLGPVEHEQPGERQRAAVLGHGPRFPGNDRAPDGRLRQRAWRRQDGLQEGAGVRPGATAGPATVASGAAPASATAPRRAAGPAASEWSSSWASLDTVGQHGPARAGAAGAPPALRRRPRRLGLMTTVTAEGVFRSQPAPAHGRPQVPARPEVAVPGRFRLDAPNRADGLELLRALPADAFPLVVLDPQYMAETVEGEGGCGEPEAGREVA